MSLTKSLCLITGAALSLSGVALAQSTNLDFSRSAASELKADALSRTSELAPADQKYTVEVHGYMQFRYVWNHRSDSDPVLSPTDQESAIGFQNARDRLNVSGNITDVLTYFIQFGWGPDDSFGTFLEDAFATYDFKNGWMMSWGKMKAPFLREELVGDTMQLAIERSVVWSTFTVGRVDGIQLAYETAQMRLKFGFNDGASTNNTDFTSGNEADFGVTARFEYKWNGDWAQGDDFTGWQQKPYFGMFGAAFHYQSGGDTFNTADVKVWGATADVSIEGDGWNVFAAAVYQHTDPAAGPNFDDWGFLAQGGIFISPAWELFGRFDMIVPDSDYGSTLDDTFSSLTIGLNDYVIPNSHAFVFSVEFQWFLDKTTGTAIVSAPNTLGSLLNAGKDGQWALTGQAQVGF